MTDNPLHDSMLNNEQLILINSDKDDDNPKYRVLVQTPGPLPYPDKGIDEINYTEDFIKEAMPSLVGQDVVDELSEHELKLGLKPKAFAHVYNSGYCPDFGGYADIEIYDPDYKPVFENMLKHRETTKRKFSTEIIQPKLQETGDNKYNLTGGDYDYLAMTTKPRDMKTGLCDVILNTKNFIGDEKVTDEIKLTKIEYDELQQFKIDKEALEKKYNEGKALYDGLKPEDFKEFQELQKEKDDLYAQLVPVWTRMGEAKTELVNSLVERLPKEDQEAAKTKFEKMEFEDLKLVNSFAPEGEPAKGAVGGGQTPDKNETEKTMKQLEEIGYFR